VEAFSDVKQIGNVDETPVKIFARISSGHLPVIGATVMALVHRFESCHQNILKFEAWNLNKKIQKVVPRENACK
jgi:predicted secreted Zn-dependent protease